MFPATPNRPDGVDDEARWQTISASDFRFSEFTTAERSAFGDQFMSGSTMNSTVHSSSAEERRVRGIYNGIDLELRNVATSDLNLTSGILHEWCSLNDEGTPNAQMTKLVNRWGFRNSDFFIPSSFLTARAARSASCYPAVARNETGRASG